LRNHFASITVFRIRKIMPTLTLKNVSPELHERLKSQARRHKRSLNQEALLCLELAVARNTTAETTAYAATSQRLRDRTTDYGSGAPDPERAEWLAQSERRLLKVWDNDGDEVYNALLEE
jgi:plasmid stability protein